MCRGPRIFRKCNYSVYYNGGYISSTFVQAHKMYNTNSEPSCVNCGLWVLITCQCRFINCNKCTILVGDVENGGGCVWGRECLGNLCTNLCQFCCELKTALKNTLKKKVKNE